MNVFLQTGNAGHVCLQAASSTGLPTAIRLGPGLFAAQSQPVDVHALLVQAHHQATEIDRLTASLSAAPKEDVDRPGSKSALARLAKEVINMQTDRQAGLLI